jgi:hypothetical protein
MSGLVYTAVQQNYRQGANDPQIQIAEDISAAIEAGTPANSIVPPTGTTDIKASLSPFVILFDDSGKMIGSTALLDGKNPSNFPSSAFDYVKTHGMESVTWQPEAGVRLATVVTRYTGTESGYVVAGRSLTEIEKREMMLMVMSLIAMLFTLILTFLVIWLFKRMDHKQMVVTETTVEISQDKIS